MMNEIFRPNSEFVTVNTFKSGVVYELQNRFMNQETVVSTGPDNHISVDFFFREIDTSYAQEFFNIIGKPTSMFKLSSYPGRVIEFNDDVVVLISVGEMLGFDQFILDSGICFINESNHYDDLNTVHERYDHLIFRKKDAEYLVDDYIKKDTRSEEDLIKEVKNMAENYRKMNVMFKLINELR